MNEERRAKDVAQLVGARGEGIIQVDGTEHRILFTNRAVAEAESSIGKGIIGLLQGFQSGTTGIGDVAHLLAAGLEAARRDAHAGGRPVTLDDAYRIMDQVGFAEVTRCTVEAISAVLSYGKNKDDEATTSPNP